MLDRRIVAGCKVVAGSHVCLVSKIEGPKQSDPGFVPQKANSTLKACAISAHSARLGAPIHLHRRFGCGDNNAPIASSSDDAACRHARTASGDCRTCGDVSSQWLMAPARLTGSGSQSIVWGIPDNCSDSPPTRVAITGRPAAIAAAATPLWLASWYGKISASAHPKTAPSSVSAAHRFSTITLWQARSASRSPHSRPRPTIRTAIGVSGGNNLIAPASRSSPLYGRSRPKNNRRGGPGKARTGRQIESERRMCQSNQKTFRRNNILSLELRSDMAAQRH